MVSKLRDIGHIVTWITYRKSVRVLGHPVVAHALVAKTCGSLHLCAMVRGSKGTGANALSVNDANSNE